MSIRPNLVQFPPTESCTRKFIINFEFSLVGLQSCKPLPSFAGFISWVVARPTILHMNLVLELALLICNGLRGRGLDDVCMCS